MKKRATMMIMMINKVLNNKNLEIAQKRKNRVIMKMMMKKNRRRNKKRKRNNQRLNMKQSKKIELSQKNIKKISIW